MIEAIIRDENKLLYILIIQPSKHKDALEVDAFIPARGEHHSATMPAGGDTPAMIARAFMTVFPPVLTQEEKDSWAAADKKMQELDKREAILDQKIANRELNDKLDRHRRIEGGK